MSKFAQIRTLPIFCVTRVALVALPLVAGACSTTISGSDKLVSTDEDAWAAKWSSLPVEVHGAVPGAAQAALVQAFPRIRPSEYASLDGAAVSGPGDRIVLYVNASALPATTALCSAPDQFSAGEQTGRRASVTGVLCQGTVVVARADGYALSRGQSAAGLKESFGVIEDQLFDVLQPGANDPDRYYN